jgi:hypothetical protein
MRGLEIIQGLVDKIGGSETRVYAPVYMLDTVETNYFMILRGIRRPTWNGVSLGHPTPRSLSSLLLLHFCKT